MADEATKEDTSTPDTKQSTSSSWVHHKLANDGKTVKTMCDHI